MQATERPAILALTGLRGLAAVWVLFFHLGKLAMLDGMHPLLRSLASSGYLGVDVFGILSGFVITYNYGPSLAARTRAGTVSYLWARLARVYPLHLVTLALMAWPVPMIVNDYLGAGEGSTSTLVQHLLLVHGWSSASGFAWNHPSWTVSCEWFCYLLASVVVPLLMRLRSGAFAALAGWLLLLAAYFILAALGLRELHASAGLGLVRIGAEFFSGCLLCIAWQRGYAANRALRAVRYAAVACMLVFSVFPAALLVVLAGWALILTLVKDPRSWLRARPVVYIGEISYSIYMLHWAVLVVVDGLSRRRQIPDLGAFQFVYVLVAVLALSVATYHFVERPARALLRRLSPGPNLTRIGARHPPPGGRTTSLPEAIEIAGPALGIASACDARMSYPRLVLPGMSVLMTRWASQCYRRVWPLSPSLHRDVQPLSSDRTDCAGQLPNFLREFDGTLALAANPTAAHAVRHAHQWPGDHAARK